MTEDNKTPSPLDRSGGDPALIGIAEEVKESGGHWQPCTGCYDTEDGHPTQKYDYSPALQTAIGCGCHECGGLGAVWWHMTDKEVEDFARICEEVDTEHQEQMRVARLKAAARDVIASASDTYKKRNGHTGSFEDASGEKCWIVPFDAFEGLRAAASEGSTDE